jgi:hypothetical protein
MTELAQTPDIAADALPLGPQSLVWRYFGDNRMFLIGPRPAVLQNMLAELGQGVLDHSVFFDDTAARVKRSLPPIFNTVYGSDTENPGQQVRDFHHQIKGNMPDGTSAAVGKRPTRMRCGMRWPPMMVDAQRALELPVRMGIPTGEAELRDGDYFGAVLNRAARVMAAGHGGQILLAESTAGLLTGVDLLDLGPRRLRDVLSSSGAGDCRSIGIDQRISRRSQEQDPLCKRMV